MVQAQDGITSWLHMSHRLIDPKHFFDVLDDPNLEKIEIVLHTTKFSNFLKVVVLQTF